MVQLELHIPSTLDGSVQPSIFYPSDRDGKRPLLVGLHTWSFDRFNCIKPMLPYAEERGFHFLCPEFRGPNLTSNPHHTEACGSLLAKQDIRDAVDYVIEHYDVDTDNIFLLGCSGGGHMALMMAGYCPEVFRCIGAFVPITDLHTWVDQNPRYTEHILACCSHDTEEMAKRSPMSYLDVIARSNTKIFHGKYDPSVPMAHSLDFYNTLLKQYPDCSVYLDIFDGGHQMDMRTAAAWIESQYRKTELTNVTG